MTVAHEAAEAELLKYVSKHCTINQPTQAQDTNTKNQTLPIVQLFSDGACSGNPGPGGWGTILRFTDAAGAVHEKELSGGEPQTTNNRMELTAVLRGLTALKMPCAVTVTTDSRYVADSIGKGWVYGWKKKGWIKSDKKPAQNVDLWEQLLPLLTKHKVTIQWVHGHAGHPENERCDRLAVAAREQFA